MPAEHKHPTSVAAVGIRSAYVLPSKWYSLDSSSYFLRERSHRRKIRCLNIPLWVCFENVSEWFIMATWKLWYHERIEQGFEHDLDALMGCACFHIIITNETMKKTKWILMKECGSINSHALSWLLSMRFDRGCSFDHSVLNGTDKAYSDKVRLGQVLTISMILFQCLMPPDWSRLATVSSTLVASSVGTNYVKRTIRSSTGRSIFWRDEDIGSGLPFVGLAQCTRTNLVRLWKHRHLHSIPSIWHFWIFQKNCIESTLWRIVRF